MSNENSQLDIMFGGMNTSGGKKCARFGIPEESKNKSTSSVGAVRDCPA